MDAHVLVTSCCSYHCIPECFHLHLLHCIYCIAYIQGESQFQGELEICLALMCACANKGEKFSGLNKGENCLIFEWTKNLLCTGLWECIHVVRVALVRGNAFQGKFRPCLAPSFPGFPSASGMTVSSTASVFEESCLCLIDCVEPLPLSEGIDLCLVKWLVLASFELLSLVRVLLLCCFSRFFLLS